MIVVDVGRLEDTNGHGRGEINVDHVETNTQPTKKERKKERKKEINKLACSKAYNYIITVNSALSSAQLSIFPTRYGCVY